MSSPWYTFPTIAQYGTPDPYGGFPKPDINVLAPAGTPITALFSGTVSGINSPTGAVPSWGNAVTIQLDTPYNSQATHTAYLHLSNLSNLYVGEHINAGDTLGYSGGTNPGPGLQQAAPGFAFYSGNNYGFDAWSPGNPALNPTSFFQSIANTGTIPATSSSSSPNILSLLGIDQQQLTSFYQKFMIFFFGGMIVLIGILIVFFSNKDVQKTGGEAAKLAAL